MTHAIGLATGKLLSCIANLVYTPRVRNNTPCRPNTHDTSHEDIFLFIRPTTSIVNGSSFFGANPTDVIRYRAARVTRILRLAQKHYQPYASFLAAPLDRGYPSGILDIPERALRHSGIDEFLYGIFTPDSSQLREELFVSAQVANYDIDSLSW